MRNKITLSEQILITSKLPDHLPLDLNYMKYNVIKNYSYGERVSDHDYLHTKNYYNLSFDINIQWINDFIVHHLAGYYDTKVNILAKHGIILFNNDGLDYHSQIDDLKPTESPDLSCLFAIDMGNNPIEIRFKYNKGRNKNLFGRRILQKRDLLILSSEVPFSISSNNNKEPSIILSLQYQKI